MTTAFECGLGGAAYCLGIGMQQASEFSPGIVNLKLFLVRRRLGTNTNLCMVSFKSGTSEKSKTPLCHLR